jgi:excinuclease ABC subunit A
LFFVITKGRFLKTVEKSACLKTIEHNLDVIRCSDRAIDLWPEGGGEGDQIVVAGTPETVAAHPISYTGRYLKKVLRPVNKRI